MLKQAVRKYMPVQGNLLHTSLACELISAQYAMESGIVIMVPHASWTTGQMIIIGLGRKPGNETNPLQ